MQIEDVLKIMKDSLLEAQKTAKDTNRPIIDRVEAKSAAKAYAHCINLLGAVLKRKGWA